MVSSPHLSALQLHARSTLDYKRHAGLSMPLTWVTPSPAGTKAVHTARQHITSETAHSSRLRLHGLPIAGPACQGPMILDIGMQRANHIHHCMNIRWSVARRAHGTCAGSSLDRATHRVTTRWLFHTSFRILRLRDIFLIYPVAPRLKITLATLFGPETGRLYKLEALLLPLATSLPMLPTSQDM